MGKLAGLRTISLAPQVLMLAAALAAVLSLSACGGSGADAPMGALVHPPGQGIAVGEPNPSAQVDKNVFINMAKGAACGDVRNRLVIIDQQQVFWDVAGNCADASYSHALFGATPDIKQCSAADSIAGPRTSCSDERYRAMFDTIVKNRDKADLGLGEGRKIEVVDLTPQATTGDTVAFEILPVNQFSGNSEFKNLVVRDAKEWSVVWKQLNANIVEPPAEPLIDFSKKMALAIFAGNASNGCSGVGVVRTSTSDGVLHVEYAYAPAPGPDVICVAAITSPAAVVLVDKFDGKVGFELIKPAPVPYKRVEASMNWMDTTPPFTAVVRDELALRKLWSRHVNAGTAMPTIDFSTQMVLFAWGGQHASGCYSTTFTNVARVGRQLYANVLDRTPGPLALCTASFIASGDVIVIDRSDDPLVFPHSVLAL